MDLLAQGVAYQCSKVKCKIHSAIQAPLDLSLNSTQSFSFTTFLPLNSFVFVISVFISFLYSQNWAISDLFFVYLRSFQTKFYSNILWKMSIQHLVLRFETTTAWTWVSSHNHKNRNLLHKTFIFVIYGHFAVNYGIFSIYEQICGQNLAVNTNL